MFDIQISKLRFVIENWELVKSNSNYANKNYTEIFGENLSISSGLCINCDLITLEYDLWEEMFKTFPKFSGYLLYPLSYFENITHITNYTETPERLELAIHCLKYLEDLKNV